ncbi:MAG: hypothetical protein V4625_00865, partial [Pseudomonadota bacterium]
MYDKSDPRSTLSSNPPSAIAAANPAKPYGTASCIHFKEGPAEEDALSRKWYGRGHNFVICYVEAKAGAR